MNRDSNNNDSSGSGRTRPSINLDSNSYVYYVISDKIDAYSPEMEGIAEGLKDIEEGRIHSHADVIDRINKKTKSLTSAHL